MEIWNLSLFSCIRTFTIYSCHILCLFPSRTNEILVAKPRAITSTTLCCRFSFPFDKIPRWARSILTALKKGFVSANTWVTLQMTLIYFIPGNDRWHCCFTGINPRIVNLNRVSFVPAKSSLQDGGVKQLRPTYRRFDLSNWHTYKP